MKFICAALFALMLAGCSQAPGKARAELTIVKLTPQPIRVPATGYWSVGFKSPGDATVYGHISAFGGSGNDISAYILSDDDYVNFLNGHQFRSYLSVVKTSADTVNVGPLPPGSYHLVFDNRFSAFTSKTVVATLAERFTK